MTFRGHDCINIHIYIYIIGRNEITLYDVSQQRVRNGHAERLTMSRQSSTVVYYSILKLIMHYTMRELKSLRPENASQWRLNYGTQVSFYFFFFFEKSSRTFAHKLVIPSPDNNVRQVRACGRGI